MPLSAGVGFVDLLPRINAAAFTSAANAQLRGPTANAGAASAKSFGQKFSAGFKQALVPIGGIAIASASLAIARLTIEFENAFTRIAAISNASAAQIRLWRDAVFELGAETAVAPQKLAEGLFFLASAGLDANQIFPALEASAKGAAIGLGEMEDITRTVAQVLNAYPEAGLKAIDVIDTLTAAVRESTAEPEEFATALGRLLPIAAKAEVEIDDLVASLSTLSNIGLDVDEGVTGIRQVLNLIVSPGKQATETLNELGISTERLRDRLADKGIINTLRFLNEKVGESEDKFRKLLPNIRAMTAAFGLTEQEAAKVDGIFHRVANSSGDLAKALSETQRGPGFKFRKTMVGLQSAAIRLGQAFLPIGTLIAGAFTAILGPATALLKLLGSFPSVLTAVFVGFASFKILTLLTGWTTSLTAALFGNTAATTAQTVALEAQAIAATEAANAQAFLTFAQARGSAVAGTTLASASAAAAAGTTAATATTGLGAALTAVNPLILLGAVAIGGIALAMTKAGQATDETTPKIERFARNLAAGIESEESLRREFADTDKTFKRNVDHFVRNILIRSHALSEAQREQRRDIVKQGRAIAEFVGPAFEGATEILTSMGTNIDQFSANAVRALRKGDEAFEKFSQGAIEDAATLIEDFHDAAAENLNFTTDALSELASEALSAQEQLATADFSAMGADEEAQLRRLADLTTGELLTSMQNARREAQGFFEDLREISGVAGEAGDLVSSAFLEMGDPGIALAEKFADAPKKVQERLVRLFASNNRLAENNATVLTNRIVGKLSDVVDILAAIAEAFSIDIDDSDATTAEQNLQSVIDRMLEVDGTTATVHVTSVFRREGGPPPPPGDDDTFFDPSRDRGDRTGALGGILGAQHGMVVRRPTLLTGEGGYHTPFGKGAEAVLPLDDHTVGRLGSSIARQIEMPTIIVKVGEEELARTVTRGQRRRRTLVGV